MGKYNRCFNVVSQKLVKHPYAQRYAAAIKRYLSSRDSKKEYTEKFQNFQDLQVRKLKKALKKCFDVNHRSRNNFRWNKKAKWFEFTDSIEKRKWMFDFISPAPSISSLIPTSLSKPASSSTETITSTTSLKNVKEMYLKLVYFYTISMKKGEKLNSTQKKTMKCSLSSILDLSDEDIESSQRALFDNNECKQLITKYSSLKIFRHHFQQVVWLK